REGGYRSNQEGGYRRPEGGHRSQEGGYRREGGYRSQDGSGRSNYRGQSSQRGGYRQGGNRPGGPHKGGPKSYGRRPVQFTDRDEEGINRMISRKAESDARSYEGRQVPDTFQEEIRLNKFIANSGVCSRREADTLIQAGVVTVNGEVVTELGTKINVLKDEVKFNGERLKGEQKVYVVMNKPKGFVTTASDPHAEKTVMDLMKDCSYRVFPVGRLDKSTTGVLMLTNDGEMAERLTHPSFDKKKIYQVILDHDLKQEDFDKILQGIELNDGEIKADELEYIDEHDRRKLGIEIHSGKNRIVRRIFESLGYEVRALDRVYFAGLTKKGLKKGEWRYLTDSEVSILRMGAFL
ncbi:MAG: rRNA pseudouridine synthase, partial [Bacteroidales bacterium]|nr:rRNA pseudouridine synthase [Bacteroidales bacterium]